MDPEIMESVLSEILEEQKASLQATKELAASLQELVAKVDSFQQNLEQQQVIAPPADTRKIEAIVTTGIQNMQQTVTAQPKPVIRQFRLLLFPELYAKEYYRIVLGRLAFLMMMFFLATCLFVLGKQWIVSWQTVQEKNQEANHAKNAFFYLYEHAGKEDKKKMMDAWEKGWEANQ